MNVVEANDGKNKWVLFTNLPVNTLQDVIFVVESYKKRWHIELLFKLYKSHIKIEIIKGKSNSYRVLCKLYAKLCGALIFHGILGCAET